MNDSTKRAYLTNRTPCWICSRQLQRMQSGANRGTYCAVEYADELGLVRHAHVQCYDTRNVLNHDTVYERDEDEALA